MGLHTTGKMGGKASGTGNARTASTGPNLGRGQVMTPIAARTAVRGGGLKGSSPSERAELEAAQRQGKTRTFG